MKFSSKVPLSSLFVSRFVIVNTGWLGFENGHLMGSFAVVMGQAATGSSTTVSGSTAAYSYMNNNNNVNMNMNNGYGSSSSSGSSYGDMNNNMNTDMNSNNNNGYGSSSSAGSSYGSNSDMNSNSDSGYSGSSSDSGSYGGSSSGSGLGGSGFGGIGGIGGGIGNNFGIDFTGKSVHIGQFIHAKLIELYNKVRFSFRRSSQRRQYFRIGGYLAGCCTIRTFYLRGSSVSLGWSLGIGGFWEAARTATTEVQEARVTVPPRTATAATQTTVRTATATVMERTIITI